MKRILVHLHVFYHGQVPYFLGKLSALEGMDWDLVVTYSTPNAETFRLFREFKPGVRLVPVENVGYDVWPFLHVLGQTDLDAYDIVVKLHTKRPTSGHAGRVNGLHMKGYMWRDILVDALLATPERFSRVVDTLRSCPEVGMVCSGKLYACMESPEDGKMLDDELALLGLCTRERRFCVGNMFALRASLLCVLRRRRFTPELFPAESHSDAGGTLAHVYERIFSLLAPAQGYSVRFMDRTRAFVARQWVRSWLRPALQFLFSVDRRGERRQRCVTVLGMRFKTSNFAS